MAHAPAIKPLLLKLELYDGTVVCQFGPWPEPKIKRGKQLLDPAGTPMTLVRALPGPLFDSAGRSIDPATVTYPSAVPLFDGAGRPFDLTSFVRPHMGHQLFDDQGQPVVDDQNGIVVQQPVFPIPCVVMLLDYWESPAADIDGKYYLVGQPLAGTAMAKQGMWAFTEIAEREVKQAHFGVTAQEMDAFVRQQKEAFESLGAEEESPPERAGVAPAPAGLHEALSALGQAGG